MKKHILCVDDELDIRNILTLMLTGQGYRVTAVPTAAEALQAVKTDPPHLIIADLQLEDADGLELIAQLKETLPQVPVILLTGMMFDPEVVNEILNKNVSCYLEKTMHLRKIVQEIHRLLGDAPPA